MKIVNGYGVENGMRKGKMCPVHLPPARPLCKILSAKISVV